MSSKPFAGENGLRTNLRDAPDVGTSACSRTRVRKRWFMNGCLRRLFRSFLAAIVLCHIMLHYITSYYTSQVSIFCSGWSWLPLAPSISSTVASTRARLSRVWAQKNADPALETGYGLADAWRSRQREQCAESTANKQQEMSAQSLSVNRDLPFPLVRTPSPHGLLMRGEFVG